MEDKLNLPRHQTNWVVRFLCDCKKQSKAIDIHKGIAHEISTNGIHILSDHQICQQKKVAMQLIIPPLLGGAPEKIIKIIGNSIDTIKKEGKFLTKIEFQLFEENGLHELEKHLHQRLDQSAFNKAVQNA